jgi:hypothetical protein
LCMDSTNEWELRTKAAINWLRRSIAATGGRGSSHSWHPLLGWNKAYPETTGYIIPTLLDYAALYQDASLKQTALDCAHWLCAIQLPGGAFNSLLSGDTRPSIFNSSQILFGLARALQENPGNETLLRTLESCVYWLDSMLEQDGSWKRHAFVPGFTPSYYTCAVWGVLTANAFLKDAYIQARMQEALQFYTQRLQSNHAVRDWGFKPGQAAFTHTIAYTLTGFLETSLILQDDVLRQKTIAAADQLLRTCVPAGGRLAGRYAESWEADYGFVCVTGNAQFSVLYHRLFELTGEKSYQMASAAFLREILRSQKLTGNLNKAGALPGSIPFWGPYLPFRYPNWAAKFFLDAMLPFQNDPDWLNPRKTPPFWLKLHLNSET